VRAKKVCRSTVLVPTLLSSIIDRRYYYVIILSTIVDIIFVMVVCEWLVRVQSYPLRGPALLAKPTTNDVIVVSIFYHIYITALLDTHCYVFSPYAWPWPSPLPAWRRSGRCLRINNNNNISEYNKNLSSSCSGCSGSRLWV